MELIITENDIEGKKLELIYAPVANWRRQRSFKSWGQVRFLTGAHLEKSSCGVMIAFLTLNQEVLV